MAPRVRVAGAAAWSAVSSTVRRYQTQPSKFALNCFSNVCGRATVAQEASSKSSLSAGMSPLALDSAVQRARRFW
jgi:hypothetical protein